VAMATATATQATKGTDPRSPDPAGDGRKYLTPSWG